MTQIGFNLDVPIKIYVDNVSAINLAKNLVIKEVNTLIFDITSRRTKLGRT